MFVSEKGLFQESGISRLLKGKSNRIHFRSVDESYAHL